MNAITVSEASALVLRETKETQRPSSLHTYQWHARNAIAYWGADTNLNDITRQQVRAWVATRKEQVKPATLRHEASFLNRLYAAAEEAGLEMPESPARRIKFPTINNERKRVLMPHEELALRTLMTPAQWSCVEFAVQTGLRRLEQWSLLSEDIRLFDKQEANRDGRLCVMTYGLARVRTSKTGKGREIPLNPRAAAIAAFWLRRKTEYLFGPEKSTRLLAAQWYGKHIWRVALRRLGITDLHWHDLRHSFATRSIKNGARREQVGKVLGHSTPQMTDRYITWDPSMLWPAVMAVNGEA